MALPKRRHSHSRTRLRRAHDALKEVGRSVCPRCHQAKLPHRVCGNCGYYGGRSIEAVEES